MAELTSSVNSLLKTISSWSYKINKIELIAEVKNGIENIKTELSTILEQISNLEPRVTKKEEVISKLRSDLDGLKVLQEGTYSKSAA